MTSLSSWAKYRDVRDPSSRQGRAIAFGLENSRFPRHRKRKRESATGHCFLKCVATGDTGFALISKVKIECGEILLSEDPVVSIQTPGNEVSNGLICDKCNRPVLGLREQLVQLGSYLLPPQQCIAMEDQVGFDCKSCMSKWCRACTSLADFQMEKIKHRLWCTGNPRVKQYEEYAADKKTPQLLIAARACILTILPLFLSKNKRGVDAKNYTWWKEYVHPKWWSVHEGLGETEEKRRKLICKESLSLLSAALEQHIQALDQDFVTLLSELLSLNNFGEIMGMLSCNAMVIDFPSPSQEYFQLLPQLKSQAKIVDKNVAAAHVKTTPMRWSKIEPNAIAGCGLYPLLSLANHRCDPNASIEFLRGTNKASLVALRDVLPGEEVSITYIPTNINDTDCGFNPNRFRNYTPSKTFQFLKEYFQIDTSDDDSSVGSQSSYEDVGASDEDDIPVETMGLEERQRRLWEYGFGCECGLCVNERRLTA